MHQLTKVCLKKPVSTVIIIVAMIIFSIAAVTQMNMQLTPDMEMPYIVAMIVYPGAAPDQIDRLVAQELEDVGATIEGLDTVQSRSMQNMCYMIYGFKYGTDVDKAYNDLQQEINRKKNDLPDDCNDPTIVIMDINAMPSVNLSVTSKSGGDVRGFVENTLDNEVSSVENVARTEISGGQEDYIRVCIDPELMAQFGLSTTSITGTITAADFSIPAGSVDVGSQTLDVNAEVSYDDIYDLESIPLITGKGKTIRLADVATVSYAKKDADSVSFYDGSDNVQLSVTKQQGSNAVKLARDVVALVDEFKDKYPDYDIVVTYNAADRIVSALSSVGSTLVLGVFLSMLVLFIFFGDIKASLIVGSSMPVSLLVTILLMYAAGFPLSVVTMGGMVIGIGMMVDNSIVVLEMCFQKRDQGFSFEEAAYDAVKTVATSIFASTLTTVVVYLPMALMKGLSGQMFAPLSFTIIFSLTASLIAAVTLVPLCFAKYHPIEKKELPVSRFVRNMGDRYGQVLGKVLDKKAAVVAVTVLMVVLTVVVATQLNVELMAGTDEKMISVKADVRPGLSLENKEAYLHQLENFVKAQAEVEDYDGTASESSSQISLTAYLYEETEEKTDIIVDRWNEMLKDTPDMVVVCSSASSSMNSGMGGGDKEVTMRSTDMDLLREATEMVADAVRDVDGVINISTGFSDSAAKAEVHIDPVKSMGAGITPAQAGAAMRNAQKGTDVMDITINETDYKVTVEYPKDRYDTIDELMELKLMSNTGNQVTLGDIAEVVYSDTPQTIIRNQKSYEASVSVTLDSEKKFAAQKEIDQKVKYVDLPANVFMAESSYAKMMREEFTSLITAMLAAMWLVFMVMTMQFESVRYSLMIMFCIPFSLIGSVLLMFISKSTFSMTSLMGFLMLEGIVVNNGILMVDTTNMFLEKMSMELALVEAGRSRLRPILMTTLTTILSMLPLALGIGKNTESMQGMAVVIVGGLIASTILTLILLPTFYLIIAKKNKTDRRTEKKFFGRRKKPIDAERDEEIRDEGADN